jgi:hypothetical protein
MITDLHMSSHRNQGLCLLARSLDTSSWPAWRYQVEADLHVAVTNWPHSTALRIVIELASSIYAHSWFRGEHFGTPLARRTSDALHNRPDCRVYGFTTVGPACVSMQIRLRPCSLA